uniref:TRAP transporter small permease subunit n=1 Tax=Limnohabitans sp. TaxID=1907725 RepID=UPI00404870DD
MSDGTTPEPLARLSLFDRLVVGMNALGSVWILLMVLMVTTDAMSRSFFAKPIAGVTELIQISIIGIVFLQIADAIRTKRMTRADSFLTLLQTWHPRLASSLEAVFFLLGAAYMALGLWGSIPLLTEAYERGEVIGNTGVFTLIIWPIKTVIVLGLAVSFIEFMRQSYAALDRAIRG